MCFITAWSAKRSSDWKYKTKSLNIIKKIYWCENVKRIVIMIMKSVMSHLKTSLLHKYTHSHLKMTSYWCHDLDVMSCWLELQNVTDVTDAMFLMLIEKRTSPLTSTGTDDDVGRSGENNRCSWVGWNIRATRGEHVPALQESLLGPPCSARSASAQG